MIAMTFCSSCLDFGLGPNQHSRSDDAVRIHRGNAVMNSPAHYSVNKKIARQALKQKQICHTISWGLMTDWELMTV